MNKDVNKNNKPTPLPPSASEGGFITSLPASEGGFITSLPASEERDQASAQVDTNAINQEMTNVKTGSNEETQTQELTKDTLIEYIKQICEEINVIDLDTEFYLFYVSTEMKKILETLKDKDTRNIQWYLECVSEDSKRRALSNFYMQYAYLYEAFQKLKEMLPTPLPPSAQGGGGLQAETQENNVDIQELESMLHIIQKNLKTSQELFKKAQEARKQLIEKLRVLKELALETES